MGAGSPGCNTITEGSFWRDIDIIGRLGNLTPWEYLQKKQPEFSKLIWD